MPPLPPNLRQLSPQIAAMKIHPKRLADCIILTQDKRLLLQERPLTWKSFPGHLMAFGGHVEEHETVMEGLCRELKEELGAEVNPDDVQKIGIITEDFTNHTEPVFIHFWHDKNGTIQQCNEGIPRFYGHVNKALRHPKAMDYLKWALLECVEKGLLET